MSDNPLLQSEDMLQCLLQKLLDIQRKLKVPKNSHSDFGNYDYRSKEDIIEAVKPLCFERDCLLTLEDDIRLLDNGWVYITVTASLLDVNSGEVIRASASAREPESKPKLDSSQVTGSTASYAGKRALGNLFAIDDTMDADGLNDQTNAPRNSPQAPQQAQQSPYIGECPACGARYSFIDLQQMQGASCECGLIGEFRMVS